MSNFKKQEGLSKQAVKRLPYYLKYLKKISANGDEFVSATTVAKELGLYDVLVRKEFAAVCSKVGRPGIGFSVPVLIKDIEDCLGYTNENKAAVVGAGHLGKALLSYQGFEDYGVELIMGFDTDPDIVGEKVNGKPIIHVDKFEELSSRLCIGIGIITAPAFAAQDICDLMVKSEIKAIWNFAPVHLNVPDDVFLQYENMVSSLAMISNYLQETAKENNESGI